MNTNDSVYDDAIGALARLDEVASLAGRRVCVLGCTGLIGSVLTSVLARANATILSGRPIQLYGVARKSTPSLPPATSHFQFIEGSLATLAPGDFDYVIHAAGAASDYLARLDQIIDTQVVGLDRWLRGNRNCAGFLFVSSTRVYGRQSRDAALTEDATATVMPMQLDNLYDAPKWFGESLCLFHAKSGLRAIVARVTNVYVSPPTLKSETVVTDFVRQARATGVIRLMGHPDSTRNYACVFDIVQGLLKALVKGQAGRAYNIGSREHLSTRALAERVAAELPAPVTIELPGEVVVPSIQRISIARAEAELGFEPQYTFSQMAPLVVRQAEQALERS